MLKHGIDNEVIEEAIAESPTFQDAVSRQGEAVLLFLESPAKYTAKLCKRCGEPFGTNYRYVAYCTDQCRAHAISEQTGVKWDWMKPELERWGFKEPPLVIPPKAFKNLQAYISVLQSRNLMQTQSPSLPTQSEKALAEKEIRKILDTFPTNPQPQPALQDSPYIPEGMDEFFVF